MSFADIHARYSWDEVLASIQERSDAAVLKSIARAESGICDLEDFKNLISPAAEPYLEILAKLSHDRTVQRFGRTMQLFAPVYLSNECQNICTYCGFSAGNKVARRTLTPAEILREGGALKKLGFDHILLLTGESSHVALPYFTAALDYLRPHFSSLSMEVQPLETDEYEELRKHGLNAIFVYQETYHRETYNLHHPKGRKSDFLYRLDAPDRVGQAGVNKIGLGALFGLEDWRAECFFTALHLQYLERKHWQSRLSVSFPRLRPHEGNLEPKVAMSDKQLVQAICAFRIFNSELELTLSTRESKIFRDHAFKLGITSMSAGSRTNPGGYAEGKEASLEQFAIEDDRSVDEIAAMLKSRGYETVWKDWDSSYDQSITTRP